MNAAARLDAHEDGCMEASKRTQEKVEDVRKKVDGLREDIHRRREEDGVWRRERQDMVDRTTQEWRTQVAAQISVIGERVGNTEGWNRRVAIAVVIACIGIVGTVVGQGAKPFIGPATEVLRQTLQR
ncbi:MAG: hypothetical protein WA210_00760 [Burkholderiaceae bacterium]